jgi:type I restriction enzyme R subunit
VGEIGGQSVIINPEGRFILCLRDGRDTPVPVDEYRREMIQRVLSEAHNLSDFRTLWIETRRRRQLIEHLLGADLNPETIREIDQMREFDLFDFFGHHGYKARALRQHERGELYLSNNESWFANMDPNAATVLRSFGNQFSFGGTEALETSTLWEVPEIRSAGGLDALRVLGAPAQVMYEAKGRLFGV